MKPTSRILIAAALVLFGTAALPFSDGFEAQASSCWSGATVVDAKNDTAPGVLVAKDSLVCLDDGVVTFNCQTDALGVCKREASPLPPVLPPTTGIPTCTYPGIAGNPYVQPAGFKGYRKQWSDIQIGQDFPNSNAYLTPVGSYTLKSLSPSTKGPSMAAKYITVEFTPEAGKTYFVSWVSAQRQNQVPDYPTPRNASTVFLSVSPCAGDLRPSSVFTSDPWIKNCRAMTAGGSFKFGTSWNSQCKLVAGVKHYLNIAMVDPHDGLTLTETTCTYRPSEGRCEVNMQAK